jgi:hypothetical protein
MFFLHWFSLLFIVSSISFMFSTGFLVSKGVIHICRRTRKVLGVDRALRLEQSANNTRYAAATVELPLVSSYQVAQPSWRRLLTKIWCTGLHFNSIACDLRINAPPTSRAYGALSDQITRKSTTHSHPQTLPFSCYSRPHTFSF